MTGQTISEYIKSIRSGDLNLKEHIQSVLQKAQQINHIHHHLTTITEHALTEAEELQKKIKKGFTGSLLGLPITVKDCITIKDIESRSSSRILKNYHPLEDATVIQKIKEQGGIIIGKTAQDAFGFGSFSTNVGIDDQIPLNPHDLSRTCGGSSGGSGGFTSIAPFPHLSLGESTGGSIEAPASFCGIVGMCPTYSRVSRRGLISYANSLDKIGPMARTVKDAQRLYNVIAGHDPLESTSTDEPHHPAQKLKVGVISETLGEGVLKDIQRITWNTIHALEDNNIPYTEISLPTVKKYGVQAYYLLSMSEASTNLAALSGLRYGQQEPLDGTFNEYFSHVRSNHFNNESKRRILLGTFTRMAGFRDAYYLKAAKVRTLIIQEYKKALKESSVLLSPTMPFIAPKFKEIIKLTPLQHFMADTMTVGPNLAGLPHINVPAGTSQNMPVGVMAITDHFQEQTAFRIAEEIEKL